MLFRSAFASDAAEALKLDANELLNLGIVDKILPEPPGGAHRDWEATALEIKAALINELGKLSKIPTGQFSQSRFEKFRKMGSMLN